MYPVGQGAHWKFKAGGWLFALGEPVNKIGLETRNCPTGHDIEPEIGEMQVPDTLEVLGDICG